MYIGCAADIVRGRARNDESLAHYPFLGGISNATKRSRVYFYSFFSLPDNDDDAATGVWGESEPFLLFFFRTQRFFSPTSRMSKDQSFNVVVARVVSRENEMGRSNGRPNHWLTVTTSKCEGQRSTYS